MGADYVADKGPHVRILSALFRPDVVVAHIMHILHYFFVHIFQ